jgi:hypothetical protein
MPDQPSHQDSPVYADHVTELLILTQTASAYPNVIGVSALTVKLIREFDHAEEHAAIERGIDGLVKGGLLERVDAEGRLSLSPASLHFLKLWGWDFD